MACLSQCVNRTQNGSDYSTGTPVKPRNNEHTNSYQHKISQQPEYQSIIRENKLPINLFHSAAQYHKMLITNGRSIQRKSESPLEGFIESLEYINEPIFQFCSEKKEVLRKKTIQGTDRKQVNSHTRQCCCDSDQFCVFCVNDEIVSKKKNLKKEKPHHEELQRNIKSTKKLTSKNTKKNKIIGSKMKLGKFKDQPKISNTQKECSSSYLSHKSFNIDQLICHSLVQFEQKKREIRLKNIIAQQKSAEHKKQLKQLEEQVRQKNRQSISKSRCKSVKSKKESPSKSEIRMEYWSSIKDQVYEELKKNPSGSLKKNSSLPRTQSMQCNHQTSLTAEMIATLKLRYEKEALAKIAKQQKERAIQKRKVKKGLEKLEKSRKKLVSECPKKRFRPTSEMIEQAFTNF